jgi:hypothetical protein
MSYDRLCELPETQSVFASITAMDGFTIDKCITEQETYAITVATPEGSPLCVDKNYAGEITELPTGTRCQ